MNIEEFAECLDRWGSDLGRWPSLQQSAGRSLLAASERADELLAEAQRLDRWLAGAADHEAPVGLQRRILAELSGQDLLQRLVDWFSAALWRPALGATCMLLLGFTLGVALPEGRDDSMLDTVGMLVFSADYEDLTDAQQ